MTRGSYLIVAYEIGKQGKESCKRLFEKVFDRVQLQIRRFRYSRMGMMITHLLFQNTTKRLVLTMDKL